MGCLPWFFCFGFRLCSTIIFKIDLKTKFDNSEKFETVVSITNTCVCECVHIHVCEYRYMLLVLQIHANWGCQHQSHDGQVFRIREPGITVAKDHDTRYHLPFNPALSYDDNIHRTSTRTKGTEKELQRYIIKPESNLQLQLLQPCLLVSHWPCQPRVCPQSTWTICYLIFIHKAEPWHIHINVYTKMNMYRGER